MTRSPLKCLLLCLACLAGGFAHAAPLALVEAVQAPAWLERNGRTEPLAAGSDLRTGDVVRTGTGARAYLMLADGSRVKLGAGAGFTLHSRSLQPQKALHGVLNVVAGAFRLTTGAIKRKTATERELTVRVGTATIGIRGTDIWGKASGERDVVALLSGRIEVTRGGEMAELNEPNTYFDAPRAGKALVRDLDAGQLNAWARETEILPGDGAALGRGGWRVLAAATGDEREALALHDRLRLAGYAVRVQPFKPEDGAEAWHYRIVLPGFASRAEAAAAAARLAALTGLEASAGR